MLFLKYKDCEEGKTGLVFFYPSRNATWLLECDDATEAESSSVRALVDSVSRLLYRIHRKAKPGDDPSSWLQYCLEAAKDLIFQSSSLHFILEGGDAESGRDQAANAQRVEKKTTEMESEQLKQKLEKCSLAEPDSAKLKLAIDERLIQVEGGLFSYNALQDANVLVDKTCFLCIDRVAGDQYHYMLTVTDMNQEVAYTATSLN